MTGTGKIANKQPFAHILLPKSYVASHEKEVKTLADNAKLLTTHFDLRTTVQHWLSGRDTSAAQRRKPAELASSVGRTNQVVAPITGSKNLDFASAYGNDLFTTHMASNRSCEQAGVSAEFCGCNLTPCQSNIRPLVKAQFAAIAQFMNAKVFTNSPHANAVCIPLVADDFMFVPGGIDCLTVVHGDLRTFEVNLVVTRNNALIGVTFGQDATKKNSPWYIIGVNTASNYGRVWAQCAAMFKEKQIEQYNTIEPTNWQYCYCRSRREIGYGPWLKVFQWLNMS